MHADAEHLHADRAQLSPPSRRLRARARRENFPVALRVLPSRHREHLLVLYSFARTVDDLGDTAGGDRLALLDDVACEIDRIYDGREPRTPLFRAVARTAAACALPREPFDRLVQANRRDQVVTRYRTFDDLLDYCSLSAEPVGRLVLGVFGEGADGETLRASDRICAALQVLEHCQDVAEDVRVGRIYLPTEDLARFGVAERDLSAPRADTAVRALVAVQVQRAVRMLDEGRPLLGTLSGAARVAVAGYLAGGRATAHALADVGFDVLAGTPRPSRARTLVELAALLGPGGTGGDAR